MSDDAAGARPGVSAPRRRRRRPSSFKPPAMTALAGRWPSAADTPGRPAPGQPGSPNNLDAPGHLESPLPPGTTPSHADTPGRPDAPGGTGHGGRPSTPDEAAFGAPAPADTVLHFRAGSMVLVAGIPGAGKSTLIHRLFGDASPADVLVLDSADIRAAFARRLGPGMPYRLYRPAVHTVHYARIAAWTLGPRRNLVVHECGTRDWARRTMARLATLRRRPTHLLLLDTPPETALAGQRSRGRLVRTGSFRRHSRQWMRLGCAVDAMAVTPATGTPAEGAPPTGGAPTADDDAAARLVPRPGRVTARPRTMNGGSGGGRPSRSPDLRQEGWTSARRLDRDAAAALKAIYFDR